MNIPLNQTQFYTHKLLLTILIPEAIPRFESLFKTKYGLESLPIFHVSGYRNAILLDKCNSFNRGSTSLISMSGKDKQKCLIVSESIEAYFREQYRRFTTDFYFKNNNMIQTFPNDVTLFGGSVTNTDNVIKI